MIIYFLLCLALLSGGGLDELAARRPPEGRMRRLVLLGSVGVFLVPFAWMLLEGTLTSRGLGTALKVAWGFSDPPRMTVSNTAVVGDIVRMSSLLQWIVLAGAGLGLIYLRLRRSRPPLAASAFVGAAVLLLALDLFRANMGFNPAIPRANAIVHTTGSIRYLQSQRPNRFIGVSASTAFEPLPADLAMNYRLYDARGYDYPTETRYDTLWKRYVNNAPTLSQPTELAAVTTVSLRALNLLSVSDLLASPGQPPLTEPGLEPVYRGSDATVYNNANALPRVFVVDRQHTVAGDNAALAASTAPGFAGRSVAITEHPLPGIAQAAGTGSARAAPAGSARIVSYGAEKIVIDATASDRSVLVLTDVFYPGWTVTVDGHSAPIDRVDYLLRGVPLSAGTHRIEFSYQPASFEAGWIISVVSTVAVIALALLGWRRRRA